MNLNSLLGNVGIKSNLAGDVSFLIIFVLISVVVSFLLGKHRVLISLLGVYIAYAIASLANFDFTRDPQAKALLFLTVLVGFIVIFSRIIRSSVSGHGPVLIVKLAIGTAIVIGLSLSIILNWYSTKELTDLITPSVKVWFTGDLYRFAWGIAPLVYLGIVRKRID